MPIYPPAHNPLMFPDRVDIARRGGDREDEPGSILDEDADYPPSDLAVECCIDVVREDPVARAMRRDDRQVEIRVGFPEDHDLDSGDILLELDANGVRTGRGLVVQVYRPLGRVHLRHWEATCSAWQDF